jgi:hypothetical protein
MQDPDFRRRFPDLTILDPVAFLKEIASAQPPDHLTGQASEQKQEDQGGEMPSEPGQAC